MPQHLKLLAKSRMNFFNRASSLSFGRSARSPKFDQEEAEDDQTGDYLREGVCKAPHQAEPARRHPKTRWYGMDADEHPEMTGWLRKRNTKAKGTLVPLGRKWDKRWFAVNQEVLMYSDSPKSQQQRQKFLVRDIIEVRMVDLPHKPEVYEFELVLPDRVLRLRPKSESQRRHWVAAIQKMRSLAGCNNKAAMAPGGYVSRYHHNNDLSAHEFEEEVEQRFGSGSHAQSQAATDRFGRVRSFPSSDGTGSSSSPPRRGVLKKHSSLADGGDHERDPRSFASAIDQARELGWSRKLRNHSPGPALVEESKATRSLSDKSSINEAVPLKLAAHEVRRISNDEWEDESELDDRDDRDGSGESPQSPIPPGREGRKKPNRAAASTADDFVNPMHNGRAHSNALFRFDED